MTKSLDRIVAILRELKTRSLSLVDSSEEMRASGNLLLEEACSLATDLQSIADDQRQEYILEGAGLGSWDWWLETNEVKFDSRWCGMLGLKLEETIQSLSSWDSRVHPEDKEKAYRDIKAYLAGETPVYENIHRMMHADGHWVWILDRGRTSEFDSNGKPIRFTGTHLDVTDFMEQQSLSEEIQRIAKIGGWELDAATGETRWTPETYRIHGIPEGTPTNSIMGINYYAAHDRGRIKRYVEECLKGKAYHDVFEFIDAKGSKKWVEVMGKPVFDSTGRVYKVAGTFQDISEKFEKNEENRFILEVLGIGLWKYNPVSQELFWDKGMHALYEIPETANKDSLGLYKAWENSLAKEAKSRVSVELQLALKGEKEFDTTLEIDTKSQGRKAIAARGKVKRNEQGDPIMMYGINYDRTKEEKIASELELEKLKSIRNAKLASLGEMSAGIAHEINNPLAIIHGTIRVLAKVASDEEQLAKKVETIHLATERIAKIVKSLRKFSRTSDKSTFKGHFLSEIVNESLVLTNAKARSHSTQITLESKSAGKILCDDIEIEQVLVNLINDAIDAIQHLNERWITLEVHENENQVILRVRDSGPRISPDVEKKMFEPFFTTKPVGKGTGLGLSISKGILDEHHASIELLGDDPHTCFEICFPKMEDKKDVI